MKLKKTLTYQNHTYSFLSDNTHEVLENPKEILFVKTPLNEKYSPFIAEKNLAILDFNELKNYFDFKMKIVGITGTNGKTTTASLMYSLLLDLNKKTALLGTRGFFINDKKIKEKGLTTPTILELYSDLEEAMRLKCEYFIMEVSSHAIVQKRIAGLDFALKILTNITSDHLDFHKSIENYKDAKNSFFKDEGLKVINRDETNALFNPINAHTYALDKKAHLNIQAFSLNPSISASLCYQQDLRNPNFKEIALIHSPLLGRYNLYNILAGVLGVKLLTQLALEAIAPLLENFYGVKGRLEILHSKPLVIVDFAHTIDGMQQVFESFKNQKIIALFGAGGDRDKTKRPKMGEVASYYAHKIVLTSDNPRSENEEDIIKDILKGISDSSKVVIEKDRKKAILNALENLKDDEVLLILGKGDENTQIFKDKTIFFSDQEVVKSYYQHLKQG
ncbi:UDP-N-acetylmuramoyl-L-alanyl-D-glutamate--2,6-diaminopimelate ligase [Helicobacter pylori]|uniref:UDP-N-acetylmuramoyl-L-alanyl-D-glutamate--2, 6-diaminopimelate ligase n=1 Tax=Helicobacter pylori TaxID=210 RepID=UPI0009531BDC|nr:UDP-N-acetylmuramoyl-L-alanyl-D-glutamate--2,6-diaminopimelate ligase [Helicobacter pylori]OLR44030.1 UDP-N-acetylmuramoyl-L-alanyl-D-glutamate--2,6-diaminopimelate ligase [Helicobacter pylori]OLR48078.1 UDP-N-acetylmuramoyl-L-alanyl-D-glutamate--2,6-diaminopimelate ligase [Helicobacter pylori]